MKQLYMFDELYKEMKTRSQTREPMFQAPIIAPLAARPLLYPVGTRELDVNIDFDLASKAWRANKKYIGDGSFKYVRNKYKEKERLRTRLQGV